MIVPIILYWTASQTRVIPTLDFSKSLFWKRDQYQSFMCESQLQKK